MWKIFFILICYGSLLLCSCSSSKSLPSAKSTAIVLSKKLGFKINRHDDLKLYQEAANWLGTPYRYGGNTRQGVDCSGLVRQIYKNVYRCSLERSASRMAEKNCRKVIKSDLQPGDLVFFNTAKKKKGINHVGIFLKNSYFIHSSTSRGVIISSLHEDFYRKSWKKGGRVKK